MNESEKITVGTFYLSGMAYDDSVLQSYRMIFIALEAILFGFAFASVELERPVLAALVACFGILCGLLWIAICRHRAKEVWAWRDELLRQVGGTKAETFLKKWWIKEKGNEGKAAFMHNFPRIVFNYVFPSIVTIAWVVLLAYVCNQP